MKLNEIHEVISLSIGGGLLFLNDLANNTNQTSNILLIIGLLLVIFSGFFFLIANQVNLDIANKTWRLLNLFNPTGSLICLIGALLSDFQKYPLLDSSMSFRYFIILLGAILILNGLIGARKTSSKHRG